MDKFHAPGFLRDFFADFSINPEPQAKAMENAWSAIVSGWMDNVVSSLGGSSTPHLFFNPLKDTTPGAPAEEHVGWDAFPRFLTRWFGSGVEADRKRWLASETLRPVRPGGRLLRRVADNGTLAEDVRFYCRQQDEYCEWHAEPDEAGGIKRVTFTCEGPEYWKFLAMGSKAFFSRDDPRHNLVEGNMNLVVKLYRELLGNQSVRAEELVWPFDVAYYERRRNPQTGNPFGWLFFARKGDYNPYNEWNTTKGLVHLTHPANSLEAEVSLAGGATVLRQRADGTEIRDADGLVCCSRFGDINRSSDPNIGSGVNKLARQGLSVSLRDPVGLYISGIQLGGFAGPNGEDVSDCWQVVRGDASRRMILRARFEVPEGRGFNVSGVKIDDAPIEFGAQIVENIQMVLTGVAKKLVNVPVAHRTCSFMCCTHPNKPEVRKDFEAGTNCSQVGQDFWDSIAPLLPQGIDAAPVPAAPTFGVAAESFEVAATSEEAIVNVSEEKLYVGGVALSAFSSSRRR